jgi:hypothetical protein
LADVFLAIALGGGLSYLAFVITKRSNVSYVPFMVIGPVLIATGLATQLPASPFFTGLQDGGYYQQWGYAVSESWRAGDTWEGRRLWPGKGFWPLVIAVFHFVAGPVLISPIVFNSLLVAFSVVFLQKSTDLLFGVKPTVMFIAVTLSSGPILLNGPTLLREGIFWFGISVSVASLAYLYREHHVTAISLLVVSILLILAIRPNYGVILAYLIAFAALVIWIFKTRAGLRTRTLIGAGCAIVLALSFAPAFTYLSQDLSNLGERIKNVSSGLSGDDVTTALRGPSSAPAKIPPSVERFLDSTLSASIARFPSLVVGPFWWEVSPEPVWIVVIASTLHYWFLLLTSTALLVRRENRNVPNLLLFLMSMMIIGSLTPVMTNYGIILRFRVVAELFLTPLSAAYIALLTAKTRSRK